MPKTKNQGKNKSRFEVRGGLLNEYEFALNEGAMTEEERNRLAEMEEERRLREGLDEGMEVPASPQEREAARIRKVMETAHEKAQRNLAKRERRAGGGGEKAGKRAGKGAARGAGKTAAGKRAAGKKGGRKAGASKKAGAGGAGRGAQKRGAAKGAKKGAAKKSAGKKGARKAAGRKGSAKKGGRSGRA